MPDFGHALKFPKMIDLAEGHWSKRLHANVWFRRLYFDGLFSGRFEIAFMIYDGEGSMIYDKRQGPGTPVNFDISRSAATIENAPVEVLSPNHPLWAGRLIDAGEALGLAYISATTIQSQMSKFPAPEIYRKEVLVGKPRIHVSTNNSWKTPDTNDRDILEQNTDGELYITSSRKGPYRKSILVQNSYRSISGETPKERTIRVLFSHLHSLMFAQRHFIDNYESINNSNKKAVTEQIVSDMIARFSNFRPESESGDKEKAFMQGMKEFGLAYGGRISELLANLEQISRDLEKPGALDKGLAALKSLYEVIVKAVVDKAMDMSAGR